MVGKQARYRSQLSRGKNNFQQLLENSVCSSSTIVLRFSTTRDTLKTFHECIASISKITPYKLHLNKIFLTQFYPLLKLVGHIYAFVHSENFWLTDSRTCSILDYYRRRRYTSLPNPVTMIYGVYDISYMQHKQPAVTCSIKFISVVTRVTFYEIPPIGLRCQIESSC